jgi:hypothetical protein
LARYRLRFLLQEFDLPPGDTLIGRGPDCRVTLVDPLVSRHHARIRNDGSCSTIEDLGSRNGTRVDGKLLRGAHVLADGNRIRIGTQELVFTEVEAVQLAHKQTGFLCHCAACRLPYPEEMRVCPNCGSTQIEEDSTLSGILDDRGRQNWALQMLIEMLRKAISLGRETDAHRIMNQAVANIDERMRGPDRMDEGQLESLCIEAIKLAELQKSANWAKWVLVAYRRLARVPSRAVAEGFTRIPDHERHQLAVELDALVIGAPGHSLSPHEADGLAALKSIRASLERAGG